MRRSEERPSRNGQVLSRRSSTLLFATATTALLSTKFYNKDEEQYYRKKKESIPVLIQTEYNAISICVYFYFDKSQDVHLLLCLPLVTTISVF